MSGTRVEGGSDIDRSKPLTFSFDGRSLGGFEGDTLASALLAGGTSVVGRSFKYHRPRGVWGAWVEEPNALVDIRRGGTNTPNCRATTEWLQDGMELRAVNATPTAAADRFAFLDRFARFIPAGFYYKTFLWPRWSIFEPRIRAMAGLGTLDPAAIVTPDAIHRSVACDVLVVGAGPAGIAAAKTAIRSGRKTILVDDQAFPGGSLRSHADEIDGMSAIDWVKAGIVELEAAGGRYLPRSTAYGIYDHKLVGVWQRGADGTDVRYQIRARKIVLATGSIERPLSFPDNDRPGVMSAEAALVYLHRYGVQVGQRIVVTTNNDRAYDTAEALATSGARVLIADTRAAGVSKRRTALELRHSAAIDKVRGRNAVDAIEINGERIDADCVLVSGGFTPSVHLYCQAGGKLRYEERIAALVPDREIDGIAVVGGANGAWTLHDALEQGQSAIDPTANRIEAAQHDVEPAISPAWPSPGAKGRQWIDLQNDVTAKDLELAHRENYCSVEHVKRYTTLGMGTDQGKTSNMNGLALMAALTGKAVGEVGTTTYRPPFVPVPLKVFAGRRRSSLLNPPRRLAIEDRHRSAGAVLGEYGGWLRPAFYGNGEPDLAIRAEALRARRTVALFDASPLGKIDVIGPQASELVDFSSYNRMSTLRPGRIRYGFTLSEAGIVYDDGVTLRLSENHYVVSCSSSHAASMHARLEEWRQSRFDPSQVLIQNSTDQWVTLTATGPRARELVEALNLGIDISDAGLPHMSLAIGTFENEPARIARVSFTGDRSYEVSVRASLGGALWDLMRAHCDRLDGGLMGTEALMVLRAEKGFIVIGKDTDGTTMPHDLGMEGPRDKRKEDYVGRDLLFNEEASRTDRKQLVGLKPTIGAGILPAGSHAITTMHGKPRSFGFVTSSYWSPTLEAPIALALVENGRSRIGEEIVTVHLGTERNAIITDACFFDAGGARLNA